jgi:hypothetical protein
LCGDLFRFGWCMQESEVANIDKSWLDVRAYFTRDPAQGGYRPNAVQACQATTTTTKTHINHDTMQCLSQDPNVREELQGTCDHDGLIESAMSLAAWVLTMAKTSGRDGAALFLACSAGRHRSVYAALQIANTLRGHASHIATVEAFFPTCAFDRAKAQSKGKGKGRLQMQPEAAAWNEMHRCFQWIRGSSSRASTLPTSVRQALESLSPADWQPRCVELLESMLQQHAADIEADIESHVKVEQPDEPDEPDEHEAEPSEHPEAVNEVPCPRTPQWPPERRSWRMQVSRARFGL